QAGKFQLTASKHQVLRIAMFLSSPVQDGDEEQEPVTAAATIESYRFGEKIKNGHVLYTEKNNIVKLYTTYLNQYINLRGKLKKHEDKGKYANIKTLRATIHLELRTRAMTNGVKQFISMVNRPWVQVENHCTKNR
ncbi:hypothetical protein ACJX0J_035492, partial [Zea mays]